MEGREEGRVRTEDIASGGSGGQPERLPEREPGAGEPDPGAGQREPGAEQGAPGAGGATPDREPPREGGLRPKSGEGWQPQSPDPERGVETRRMEGGGALTGESGAATTERTEGGAAPGSAGAGAVEERGAPGGVDAEGGGGQPVDQPGQGQPAAASGDRAPGEGAESGGGTADRPSAATAESAESTPLLSDHDASDFERRWQDVQVGFVDEPQRCVQEADSLVTEVMQRLADGFAQERKDLEAQWSGGGEPSTEDLRVALQRYRSFFNRLLKTT